MAGDKYNHDRMDLARDLWLNGQTYQQIADTLDPYVDQANRKSLYASSGAARNAVMAAIRRHAANERRTDEPEPEPVGPEPELDSPTVVRSRISQQWDMIINHWMPKVMEGDDAEATGIVARALQSQARLYGVNLKPASVPEEKPGGESPVDEVADRRRRRRERRQSAG
jgi:hypothetical protein